MPSTSANEWAPILSRKGVEMVQSGKKSPGALERDALTPGLTESGISDFTWQREH